MNEEIWDIKADIELYKQAVYTRSPLYIMETASW